MIDSARSKLRSGGCGGGDGVGFVSGDFVSSFYGEFSIGVSVAGVFETHCTVVVDGPFLLLSCSLL